MMSSEIELSSKFISEIIEKITFAQSVLAEEEANFGLQPAG